METTMKIMSKKVLIVYYSLTGNTKFIGDHIAEAVDADILQIFPKKDVRPFGMMKYLIGCKDVFFHKKPKLKDLDFPPQLYQVIFIGTPVWAGSYVPAFNTFFEQEDIRDKKLCFFCCHRNDPGSVFDKMKEALPGNEYLGEKDFNEKDIKSDRNECLKAATLWAKGLLSFLEDEEREKLERSSQQ